MDVCVVDNALFVDAVCYFISELPHCVYDIVHLFIGVFQLKSNYFVAVPNCERKQIAIFASVRSAQTLAFAWKPAPKGVKHVLVLDFEVVCWYAVPDLNNVRKHARREINEVFWTV